MKKIHTAFAGNIFPLIARARCSSELYVENPKPKYSQQVHHVSMLNDKGHGIRYAGNVVIMHAVHTGQYIHSTVSFT